MFTIRCTRALLGRLHVATPPVDAVEPTTRLGDWYANTLNIGRRRLLLCTSERSLLTVVIPAAPLADFPSRLRSAVAEQLEEVRVSEADIARELREMAWHHFGRTRSRQVLGSMNDFAFAAGVHLRAEGPERDLATISRLLNKTPCRPIQYRSPSYVAPALFRHSEGSAPTDCPIYRLGVALQDIRPPIWRRIEVASDISLLALHRVLQTAMGWTDSHLHQFIHRDKYYGTPDPELELDRPTISERRTRLDELLEQPNDRLIYEYDFGDSWIHDVVLESIVAAELGVRYPRVIGGERACPPEDVGGARGYREFLDAIRDPTHPEHASMLEWIGGEFDPERGWR